jgi:hypothetical protein
VKRSIVALTALIVGTACLVPAASASATATLAHEFANCTDMNKTYPHGVGRKYAHDHTSGTPVTNFKRSNALYAANKKSDRDGDHVACEKR